MLYAGFDLHSQETRIWIENEKGEKVWHGRVPSTEEGWVGAVAKYKGDGIEVVMETGRITYSAVLALRGAGIEPVVVNPRQVKMIAESKKKSDKRDARVLAQLLRTKALDACRVHIPTEEAREIRSLLVTREHLIRHSTAAINAARALGAQAGIRVGRARLGTEKGWQSFLGIGFPEWMKPLIECHHNVWLACEEEMAKLDQVVIAKVKGSEAAQRITEVPGVGAISALSIISAVDDPKRFPSAKEASSYCGITPRPPFETGQQRSSGRITKEGRSHVRKVFIQGAHAAIRSKRLPKRLRNWVMRLIMTKGIQKAAVALAHKLIRIVFGMLRDGTRWEPQRWEAVA